MKKIIVASHNPVKIRATLEGFQTMFPSEMFEIAGVNVPSGVRDQPLSDQETLQGALQRAEGAFQCEQGADYWVGIEGGIEEIQGEMEVFAWAVVKSSAILGKGKTGTFFLPQAVVKLVKEGKELGEADDIVFKRHNSKQENGAVGILTDNVIDRTGFYKVAVLLALIPFKHPELY